MSDRITITLRGELRESIEVVRLSPGFLAELSERDIASLRVFVGNRSAQLGDFFDVRGERSADVVVQGALSRVSRIGAGMTGGTLVVEGDAGHSVGAAMSGGTVTVRGSVGDQAGLAMSGGVLRIDGHAGDWLGAAAPGASKGMTGGEIVVSGNGGRYAGARARRGLIAIGGNTADSTADAMIAGTVIVLGRVGASSGLGNKRGSIIAAGDIEVPPTYAYACRFEPPHVRVVMQYLRQRHRLPIDDQIVTGHYRRYCGDAGDPGKGEILAWDRGRAL